ncbi:envelope membrane protein [Crinalium epipsammum PCC 9333]|uniref:Proton extrusion protein PxcA n=1 Tax=Crinalium epipsammum PCC 9333 TaxID=1173022 RepID=K9W3E6_9CYAN|nr:proton extrusion protein PcxA [Crinalium epipsammum]AFZ14726.1 envelope membrane protein [Crinalium epipsammum PCC 9333]
MKTFSFNTLNSYIRQANQWFNTTPERSLDQAYQAALMIKAIEDEHFGGNKITAQSSTYGSNVASYFQTDLKKYLNIAKIRLTEFKASRYFKNLYQQQPPLKQAERIVDSREVYVENKEKSLVIIEKLKFIDEVLGRYTLDKDIKPSYSVVSIPKTNITSVDEEKIAHTKLNYPGVPGGKQEISDVETISDKTGILPRSILGTFKRLRRDLDPQAENEVIKNFRTSKAKTLISIKFILLLILIPLLTQQVTKTFIVSPIVDQVRESSNSGIFLNIDLEEEAFTELERFEKELKFKNLIGLVPKISSEEIEEQIKEKADKLQKEFQGKSSNAVKNVFADIFSLVAFATVILTSRQDILVLKSFIDDMIYGLSDSAKAFIIILFTDIFVGFHSPHGWEVILETIAEHLGLPANREFNFLFIATFPVILDTVFKYWIFRYLNRISPSAVATYRNMNE